MSRLDQAALTQALTEVLGATPDATGAADIVCEKGSVVIASDANEMKAAFKQVRKIDGYRWVGINREDLFAANSLSIGSKAGIMDAAGKILKAADVPRKKL